MALTFDKYLSRRRINIHTWFSRNNPKTYDKFVEILKGMDVVPLSEDELKSHLGKWPWVIEVKPLPPPKHVVKKCAGSVPPQASRPAAATEDKTCAGPVAPLRHDGSKNPGAGTTGSRRTSKGSKRDYYIDNDGYMTASGYDKDIDTVNPDAVENVDADDESS